MSRLLRVLLTLVVLPGLVVTVLAAPGSAHEEREASFPDGSGQRPTFLGYDNDRSRVVCKPNSARRIAAMPDGRMKRISRGLLDDCRFRSIQSAINTVAAAQDLDLRAARHLQRAEVGRRQPRSDYCSHLSTDSDDPLAASSYIGSISEPGERARARRTARPRPRRRATRSRSRTPTSAAARATST